MADHELLQVMRPLSHEERIEARKQAAHNLAGDKPERKDFDHHTISKYGPGTTRAIYVMAGGILLATFAISAIRLYNAGHAVNLYATNAEFDATVGGASAVIMAEIGMVIFSLAFAVLRASLLSTLVLGGGVFVSAAVAIVGNLTVANPLHAAPEYAAFAWLDALVPPAMVLGVAYVLKERLLEIMEMRHTNEDAYKDALSKWQAKMDAPESEPAWTRYYWNALRDAIYKANARTKGRDARNALSTQEWNMLLQRELHADNALNELQAEMQQAEVQVQRTRRVRATARVHSSGASENAQDADASGVFSDAIMQRGASWVAVCPKCGREFEKPTEIKARLAMTGHYKRCVQDVEPVVSSNGHGPAAEADRAN